MARLLAAYKPSGLCEKRLKVWRPRGTSNRSGFSTVRYTIRNCLKVYKGKTILLITAGHKKTLVFNSDA